MAPRKAAPPIATDLVGMFAPAIMIAICSAGGNGIRDSGNPMAMDVAMALGVAGAGGKIILSRVRPPSLGRRATLRTTAS